MMLMPEARAGWNKVSLLFLNKFSGFFALPPTEDANFVSAFVTIQLARSGGLKQRRGSLAAVCCCCLLWLVQERAALHLRCWCNCFKVDVIGGSHCSACLSGLVPSPGGAGWCGRRTPVPREEPVGHPGWGWPLGCAPVGCAWASRPSSVSISLAWVGASP